MCDNQKTFCIQNSYVQYLKSSKFGFFSVLLGRHRFDFLSNTEGLCYDCFENVRFVFIACLINESILMVQ